MIHHPNIVTVVEVIYEHTLIFVVMEYCSTGELFQYLIDHGRLREADCRRIFTAVIAAISHLHSRGIVHRDLKPENILLTDHLVPKIADLGLCRLVAPDALMRTPCGSPQYVAPEVLAGKGYDGRASDIWSLGVTLFVMATASLPWRSTDNRALFLEIACGRYSIPGYLTGPLRALIQKMMCPNVAGRFTIEEVARSPWLTAQQDEFGVEVARGVAKAISFDIRVGRAPAGRGAETAVGLALVKRPGIMQAHTIGQERGPGASPLELLIRKVPSSGRRRSAGVPKEPT
jgi:serine/threonine protein kinase